MNSFLELVLKISLNKNLSEAQRIAAIEAIAIVMLEDTAITARLQRINSSLLAQLTDDDTHPLIPSYPPTPEEVERLQASFVQVGYDLHHHQPDRHFPKGVFYAEKLQR